MNEQLQSFARAELKSNLAQCNEKQKTLFKRMYAEGEMELPINEVVDRMPESKLDWAMQQVSRTLQKEFG